MLEGEGVSISYCHDARNVHGYDLVVYTVAISEDNPEYKEAQRLGIPTVSRADYLGYIMRGYKNRVGISGAHGKSTCTSMLAHTFIHADADPTVVSGAVLDEMGGAYRVGGEDNFIFEACEYMDNFLSFYPSIAVVLNVEYDHSDYFADIDQTYRSFSSFASLTKGADGGLCVYNADDEKAVRSVSGSGAVLVSFGINANADYRAVNINYSEGHAHFDIEKHGERKVHIDLTVAGEHNIYNALAAFAVCDICGLDHGKAAEGIGSFGGCKRRMEFKGVVSGAKLYEDYAHHPTELRATIRSARDFTHKRVLAVFQPHTYSRTSELYGDFVSALSEADEVVMAEIYSARETNTYGVSSEQMALDIGEKARYIDSFGGICDHVRESADENTVVLIMGAGDIYKVSDMLVTCG
jgi:UDP-N-acetylmuramate--alanine ligase